MTISVQLTADVDRVHDEDVWPCSTAKTLASIHHTLWQCTIPHLLCWSDKDELFRMAHSMLGGVAHRGDKCVTAECQTHAVLF